METKRRQQKLSEQLREAILAGPMSRRQIALQLGIDEGQLSRFMNFKGGLSMEGIDKVAALLGLELKPIQRTRAKKGR